MPGILDYYASRQGRTYGAGSAPALMQALAPPDPTSGGRDMVNAFQGVRAQNHAMRQDQAELDKQDALLAQQQAQADQARSIMFDEVAAGSLDPRTLQQFDAAGGPEAQLAIAQQSLAPPEAIDPNTQLEQEVKLAIAQGKISVDEARLALDQNQGDRGLDIQEQGLSQDAAAAQQGAAFQQQQLAQEAALAREQNVIDQQNATPDILQLVEAAGLEPTEENVQRMAEAQAARTIEAPKAPNGYQFKADGTGVEPIQGGPADPLNPKNFTGEQRKVAGFHNRAAGVNEKILNMEAGGFSPVSLEEKARGMGGRMTMSDEGKAYQDLQNEFIRVVLRKDTGAAVTEGERAEYARYFPEFGDGPDDLARKAEIRGDVIQGLRDEAGGALEALEAEGGGDVQARVSAMSPEQRANRLAELRAKRGG